MLTLILSSAEFKITPIAALFYARINIISNYLLLIYVVGNEYAYIINPLTSFNKGPYVKDWYQILSLPRTLLDKVTLSFCDMVYQSCSGPPNCQNQGLC